MKTIKKCINLLITVVMLSLIIHPALAETVSTNSEEKTFEADDLNTEKQHIFESLENVFRKHEDDIEEINKHLDKYFEKVEQMGFLGKILLQTKQQDILPDDLEKKANIIITEISESLKEEPVPLGINKFKFEDHFYYYYFEIWLDEHFADWIIEWGLPGGLGMLCIFLCSALSLTGVGAILVPTVMLAARMIINNYTREQLEKIHQGDGIIIYITDYIPFFIPSPFDTCRIQAQ